MWKRQVKQLESPESYISITLGFLVVVISGLLLFNYFTRQTAPSVTPPATQQTQQTTTPAPQPTNVHTVVAGESLWTLSEKYLGSGFKWQELAKQNNMADPRKLEVGQQLTIPTSPETAAANPNIISSSTSQQTTYTVVRGDSLWTIAVKQYGDGYAWNKIATENNLSNPNLIYAGNVLRLPS